MAKAHVYNRDHINTDEIIPARYLNTDDEKELARHCLEDLDKDFVKKVKRGDVVVAGEDFGCGSSREHAVWALRGAGVQTVIAKSFARIHLANLINFGILPLTFKNLEDYNLLSNGDKLQLFNTIDCLKEKNELKATLLNTGKQITLQYNLSKRQREIILAGGLLNFIKNKRN